MRRRAVLVVVALAAVLALLFATMRRPFPPDTTPEGSYLRIVQAVTRERLDEAFPYLETDAQWAAYTVRDMRKAAYELVLAHYPEPERTRFAALYEPYAKAPDGPDAFARIAAARGWTTRLRKDLSGVAHEEIDGPRATVVTARGTRYPFRLRDNGIWGLTIFTADLLSDAEKASRDLEVVKKAAADYDAASVKR
jgi:hypothetical protein